MRKDSNLGEESSASEQSAKDFSLGETKFLKRKSVGTFNASAARQPREFFIAGINVIEVNVSLGFTQPTYFCFDNNFL